MRPVKQNIGSGAGALVAGVLLFGKANGWWEVDDATLALLPVGGAWLINNVVRWAAK